MYVPNSISSPASQSGAVLVVGLIFLMILTLIGVTAIRTATMEERMAGNARDRSLALQAAEAALRGAEDYVSDNAIMEEDCENDPGASTASGIAGCLSQIKPDSVDKDYDPGNVRFWRGHNWAVHSQTYDTTLEDTAAAPQYVIELMPPRIPPEPEDLADKDQVYRLTARGFGLSGNAVVHLQGTYIKP